jgi:O-antigen ligase
LFDYTVEQAENPANEESQLRVLEIATAFDAFRAAPLFGSGIGSGLGTVVFNGTNLMFEPLHNYYLNVLAKAGFAGLALLVVVGFCALKLGRALHASASCDLEGALALCAITSLIWWGIFIALHPVYVTYHVAVLVGVFFGMALALQASIVPARRRNCKLWRPC